MEPSRRVIVNVNNLDVCLQEIAEKNTLALDTETYGLDFTDRLFSLILSSDEKDYYFNFKTYPELHEDFVLKFSQVKEVFSKNRLWILSNAKFDMRRLWHEGVELLGTIHDTEVGERLLIFPDKTLLLGLDACAKRRGWAKDARVDEWITQNKAVSRVNNKWKKKSKTNKHFNLVPFDLISEYGCKDGELSYRVGKDQMARIEPDQSAILDNERRLTHTCFRMETTGIRVDTDYVVRAFDFEMGEVEKAKEEFTRLTGVEYKDSAKVFASIVEKDGIEVPKTPNGRPSFSDDNLALIDHPIVDIIRRARSHSKLADTYYSNFMYYQVDGVIHPDMRQAGTVTGRFSYREPNLQNVPKEDEGWGAKRFLVRKSFVPFEGMVFVMLDYKQQEYRMMVDYAGEKKLIKAIQSGEDLHDATARFINRTRKKAKSINFSVLYGQGVEALGESLGVSKREARQIRDDYFAKLPRVERLLDQISRVGRERGYVRNWAGRFIRLQNRGFAYKLPNAVIQGGCADVLKIAMNMIDDYMIEKKMKSVMHIQVHDELLFGFVPEELGELPKIIEIMESVYQSQNGVKLEVDAEHSWKSWGQCDRVKGLPQ